VKGHRHIASRVVKNDRLKLGVLTLDGKGTWSRADGDTVEGARQSSYDADGSSLQTFGALRATLTSSSVCPCVGQQHIGSKEGEATAFRELLPRICAEFAGLFRIVTGDAGLCARENAALVTELDRWYLFSLKGNQPHLHDLARNCQHYSIGKPLAQTAEKYRGHTIVRELFARDVAGNPEVDIKAAQQFWYVCQTTHLPNGDAVSVEQRYFVTSIPTGTLTRDQELALVRMHWAIENGCHWTMDMMLREDDAQPCQASRASIETRVVTRDISPALVARGRAGAARFGVEVPFEVWDMRTARKEDAGRLGAVIAFDNALPHLLADDELHAALRAAHAALRGRRLRPRRPADGPLVPGCRGVHGLRRILRRPAGPAPRAAARLLTARTSLPTAPVSAALHRGDLPVTQRGDHQEAVRPGIVSPGLHAHGDAPLDLGPIRCCSVPMRIRAAFTNSACRGRCLACSASRGSIWRQRQDTAGAAGCPAAGRRRARPS
jgi:hypothetical protein